MNRRAINLSMLIGGAIVILLLTIAIIGPMVVRADPIAVDLRETFAAPGKSHPLGCDSLGRDLLARAIWGARISLLVSISVVGISLLVGTLVGGAAGLAGGLVDEMLMRTVDVLLAFPGILLAIALAAFFGGGLPYLIGALSAIGWTGYARLVRGEVLSLREREYVQAAHALGARPRRVLLRHLIPGLAGAVAVQATFGMGAIIVAEAALSFLGLGVRPPAPTWGAMLDEGRAFLLVAPHLTTVPGVAIGLSVLGFNCLGDGLAQLFGVRS